MLNRENNDGVARGSLKTTVSNVDINRLSLPIDFTH